MTTRAAAIAFALLLGLSAPLPAAELAGPPAPPQPAAAEREGPAASLSPFGKVLGTVVDAANERPIAGALVVFAERTLRTLDNGLFECDPVLLGRYAVTAKARGYESSSTVLYVVPPLTTVRLELKPVLSTCPYEALPPETAAPRRPADRTVVLNPPAPDAPTAAKPVRPHRKEGADRGTAAATGRQGRPAYAKGTAEVTAERPVDPASGFGTLDCLVRTGEGTPLAGARIEIGSRVLTTGPDGRYSLVDAPVGTYQIVASKKGYKSDALRVRLPKTGAKAEFNLAKE